MNYRHGAIHIAGSLILLSMIYHSSLWYIGLLVIIPVSLVSLGVHLEHTYLKIAGLMIATFFIPYPLASTGMGDIYALFLFLLSAVIPLTFYWWITLSDPAYVETRSALISTVYFATVLLVFYAFISYFNISEFILDEINLAPQSMLLAASVLLVLLPFFVYLEIKSS